MFTTTGHTGTTYPLMILVGALESAKAGDKIIVASYGNGSDGLLQVSGDREVEGQARHQEALASKKDLGSYGIRDVSAQARHRHRRSWR